MKQEDKLLLAAFFIILALLFIGITQDGLTGYLIKESSDTTILISPPTVSTGEILHITVIPGSDGVHQKTSFYQAEDNLRKLSVHTLCSNFVCTEEGSFSFFIPLHWESGVYHVKMYDYATKKFIVEDFTVV